MDNITIHHYSWENPLPALAVMKYSTDGDGEKFYTLDPPSIWNLGKMRKYVYKDPVQVAIREILARSFIMFFNTFTYQWDPIMQLYGAQFSKHHEQMILDCVDIMDKECDHYITWTMMKYGSDVQLLRKALQNNNRQAGKVDSGLHGHNHSQKELEQSWCKIGISYV